MRLTLDEKIARNHALNLSELARATGYHRNTLGKMNLPLVSGKMRLPDFWELVKPKPNEQHITTSRAKPELKNDLRILADILRVPRKSHARRAA